MNPATGTLSISGTSAALTPDYRLGGSYHVELTHHPLLDGLVYAGALDLGPSVAGAQSPIGLAALVGSEWHGRRWFGELTAGPGIEVMRGRVVTTTITNSSEIGASATKSVTDAIMPVFYVRGEATLGRPVSDWFDLVGGLRLQVVAADSTLVLASATFGVRLRLP